MGITEIRDVVRENTVALKLNNTVDENRYLSQQSNSQNIAYKDNES